MGQAKITDLICLGLISFNIGLAIHFSVANWLFSLLIITITVPIAIIFLVGAERKVEGKEKSNDDEQIKIILSGALSIVGGMTSWLLI